MNILKTTWAALALTAAPAFAAPSGHWAVCVPVADVHKTPSARSEQVTQALLGDEVQVIRHRGKWSSVRVLDQSFQGHGYPGWVQDKDLAAAPVGQGSRVVQVADAPLFASPERGAKPVMHAYYGTKLLVSTDQANVEAFTPLLVPGRTAPLWARNADLADPKTDPLSNARRLVDLSKQLKGTHYLWGGMSKRGIDCSGLTYTTYRVCGISLPRDADQQFKVGEPVEKANMQVGDLMFFGTKPGVITHVGMFIGDGKFIQSSGSRHGVQVTDVDDPFYVPIFQGARRFWHPTP